MSKKRDAAEEIIRELREAEGLLSQGLTVASRPENGNPRTDLLSLETSLP